MRHRDANAERFDERRLVESARRDADAFAVLYRHYVHRIHAFAWRRSGSAAVADDVTSATFEKALRNIGRYRWREPGIGPWLFRIAANELVDDHRRAARQVRVADRLAAHPREMVREPEALDGVDADLRDALDRITPRYQRALALRYLADLTNEEAAAAFGVSRSTMAVIVHRALASLRRELAAAGSTPLDREERSWTTN